MPVLVEMLDPQEKAGVEVEENVEMRPFKRALITINALRASSQFAEKNSDADLVALQAAVEKLLASDPTPEIRIEATATLQHFEKRAGAATG